MGYYPVDYKPSGLASNPGLGLGRLLVDSRIPGAGEIPRLLEELAFIRAPWIVDLGRLADGHFAVTGLAGKGRALADVPGTCPALTSPQARSMRRRFLARRCGSVLIGIPTSVCFRNPMNCSSLYLLALMSIILHKLTDFFIFNWYCL
jgi:hypothetical protein